MAIERHKDIYAAIWFECPLIFVNELIFSASCYQLFHIIHNGLIEL